MPRDYLHQGFLVKGQNEVLLRLLQPGPQTKVGQSASAPSATFNEWCHFPLTPLRSLTTSVSPSVPKRTSEELPCG
eukprot:1771675-Heterocapsa_arctica.AAC.1